jgi:ATP-dependent Clp protease adaptor protein ClpS
MAKNLENDKEMQGEIGVIEKSKEKLQKPPMYKVMMFNDDYTPMEFVVIILKSIFRKSEADASLIMLNIHQKGFAVVGVYTHEVAETKTHQANESAKRNEFPLLTKFEPE